MAKHNLGDLIKRGVEHTDDKWDPPAGEKLQVVVSQVFTDINDDGLPRWGVQFVVRNGEYEGNRIRHNIGFSTEWDFLNKKAVDHLTALGLTTDFVASADPEAVGAALEGKKAVLIAAYRTAKKGPNAGKTYGNHTIEASRSAAPPAPEPEPVDVDDDDDELFEDDD